MQRMSETGLKLERLRACISERKLDAYLISLRSNFAWLTGGGYNHVGMSSDTGAVSLLVTRTRAYALTDNIEMPRVQREELAGKGFIPVAYAWYQAVPAARIRRIVDSSRWCSDDGAFGSHPLSITELHAPLLPQEIERYAALGADASRCVTAVCRRARPGMSEYEIAGMLAHAFLSIGILPAVLLIAADERIRAFRHPLPTSNKLRRHLMVVVCAQRHGLIVSLTRFVHFGKVPRDLERRHAAAALVDAAFILSTRSGRTVGDVFRAGVEMYRRTGFAAEWKLHHQGGPTGYHAREYRAGADSREKIVPGRAFAWNPSITGAKSEDTIITVENPDDAPRILTEDPAWPMMAVEYEGDIIRRPDILVR